MDYANRLQYDLEDFRRINKAAQADAFLPDTVADFIKDPRVAAVLIEDGCFVLDLADGYQYGGGSMIWAEEGPDAVANLAADLAEVTAN